jgi:hypothetical protein
MGLDLAMKTYALLANLTLFSVGRNINEKAEDFLQIIKE